MKNNDNDKTFQFLKGINFKEAASSKNPVFDAVRQAAGQKDVVGVVMKHALELTGSEKQTFDTAISTYEEMLAPMMEKIKILYDDEDAMKEIRRRIKKGQTSWKKE